MSDFDGFLHRLIEARRQKFQAEDIEQKHLVDFVRAARSSGMSIRNIAQMSDVSKSTIDRLLHKIEKGEV